MERYRQKYLEKMAGIIGTMTAQARLRRGRKEILSNKCVYNLKPFPPHGFNPEVHNKYMLARRKQNINGSDKDAENAPTEDFSVVKVKVLFSLNIEKMIVFLFRKSEMTEFLWWK